MSDHNPLCLVILPPARPHKPRLRFPLRWAIWAVVVVFTPVVGMAAYQPGWLLPANNLSDLVSAATARTNLGVPPSTRTINTTSPVTGGGDLSADRTIAVNAATATTAGLVPTPPNNTTTFLRGDATFATPPSATATVAGYVPTPPNNTTTFLRGDATFAAVTVAPVAPTIYTSTLPVTLAATNGLLEVIEMASPAAGVINLPATPAAGTTICIKDGLKNFASNIATVKTTDSGTIDKVAGATGYAMNQNGQQTCFVYAASGTNWYIQ